MVIKRERDTAIADVREATRASTLDPLTGIANRRGLAQRFADAAHGRPLGIAVIDCDHFKRINDNFGHAVGDDVLVAVADSLEGPDLYIGRLGGEEFVALIYDDNWEALAEEARSQIEIGVRMRAPQIAFRVTATAGLARVRQDDTLETAIKRADRALYAAKDAGRDRSLLLPEYDPGDARIAQVC
jgi:diguanylate cyclase (GGDEF)-like protein